MPTIRDDTYCRTNRMVPTPDQWYPCFEGNLVQVSVIYTTPCWPKPSIRVCVWGRDDFGLEKDLFFDSVEESKIAYNEWSERISRWGIVTIAELRQQGFDNA